MLSCFVPQRSPVSSIAKTEKQALLVSIKKNQVEKNQKMRYLLFNHKFLQNTKVVWKPN